MTETLRECPFCGGTKVHVCEGTDHAYVTCDPCTADGPMVDIEDFPVVTVEAIAAWNRRTPPPIPEAVKEAYLHALMLRDAAYAGYAACGGTDAREFAAKHAREMRGIRETLRACGYDLSELEE